MGGVAIGSDGEGEGGDGRMAVVMRREERWAEMVREIEGTWFWEVGERDGTRGWWSMVVRKEKWTGGQGWVDCRAGPCMGANPVGIWV